MKALTSIRSLTLIGLWLSALSSLALFTIGLSWQLGAGSAEQPPEDLLTASEQGHRVEQSKVYQPLPTASPSAVQVSLSTDKKPLNSEPITPPKKEVEAATALAQGEEAKVAIIIDDLGYQWRNGVKSIDLQGDYTLAILPFSPYSSKLAQRAEKNGKEVMLHAPMEPINHHAWGGGLSSEMSRSDVQTTLSQMLQEIPQAQGVNNHMGSALTQNSEMMSWVMAAVAQKGLYFIDSLTTPNSKAYLTAQQFSIPSQKRDVFLDNDRSLKAMSEQLNKLLTLARKYGSAIAICHPYPETLAFLNDLDAMLTKSNVRLVSISNLLSVESTAASQEARSPAYAANHPANTPTDNPRTEATN